MKAFMTGILHPEAFHGHNGARPFFEGWYLKLVTAGEPSRSLAIIPGIFRGLSTESHHAFVQIVDGAATRVRYERLPVESFQGAADRFDVRMGAHRFHEGGVELDLPHCRGRIRFGKLEPWPVRWSSPGAMGWYAWVPVMQCYHGVLSLDHSLEGSLEVDGEHLNFDGGRGYIEKDWGQSFPKRWVWMQCNHFDEPGVCVSVSIADVPWFGGAFPGFLVAVWRGGQLLRFTSYTGARVTRVEPQPEGVTLSVEDKTHRLEVFSRGGRPVPIHMPSTESMEGLVEEHLGASMEVRLVERSAGRSGEVCLFEGVGREAAFEVQGDVTRLRRRFPLVRDGS